jgi:phosphoesterase RecJ-like protein
MIETQARNATAGEVVAELRKRTAFVMVSHVKPDGDTLGAGLALGLALRALGKRVYYFQRDPVPRNLRFLPDADRVARELPADLPADTLWVFGDMSDIGRAGEFLPPVERANTLNIDHHLANTRFGGLNYVLETECSTGACVLRLIEALAVHVTPQIATCLLTTIMTDTGCFMHSNATAEVLRISAKLVDQGADREAIVEHIYGNKRFAAVRLVGAAMAAARLDLNGRYCWTVVDDAMLAAHRADGEDTEEIVQELRHVDGVTAAALFKAYDNDLRVSLRSNGAVNVQKVAQKFGGGGHFRAAGLTYNGPLEEAIAAVRAALEEEGA